MSKLIDYEFPSDLEYIFIDPITFFWVKRQTTPEPAGKHFLYLGFPELITKNFTHTQLKFGFRSEKLSLRENKPFLRLLTKNKLFEFLAPWKSNWQINPEIKNNNYFFVDNPYDQYIIQCTNFEDISKVEKTLKPFSEIEEQIKKLLEKDPFSDCRDCPDLLQGSITRRSNGFR